MPSGHFETRLLQPFHEESFYSQRRRNQQRVQNVIPASCRRQTQQHKCRAQEGAEIHHGRESPCQFDVGEQKHPKYGVDEEAEQEQGHDVDDSRQGDHQGKHHFTQTFGHLSPKLTRVILSSVCHGGRVESLQGQKKQKKQEGQIPP